MPRSSTRASRSNAVFSSASPRSDSKTSCPASAKTSAISAPISPAPTTPIFSAPALIACPPSPACENHRHSGARRKAVSPESMNTGLWKMDSGLAAARRPGMTVERTLLSCASPSERLRQLPGLFRQGARQLSLLGRVGARSGAVDRAFGDALQDRGDAEQAVDEIKL